MYRLIKVHNFHEGMFNFKDVGSIALDSECDEDKLDYNIEFEVESLDNGRSSRVGIKDIFSIARDRQFYMQYSTKFSMLVSTFSGVALFLSKNMKYIGLSRKFEWYNSPSISFDRDMTDAAYCKVKEILENQYSDDFPHFDPECEDKINMCSHRISKEYGLYSVRKKPFVCYAYSNIFDFMFENKKSIIKLRDNTLGFLRPVWYDGRIENYIIVKFEFSPKVLVELI